MRKKFTMLLAALSLVMGTAWAETVTVVNTDRWYQFCCTADDNVHQNGAAVWLADGGTAFAGKSTTPTFFKFIPASEGKYYLFSLASEKYVNVNVTSVIQGETASTEWTVGTINEEGYVYISSSDKNYLNNAGGTNNIQIKNHPQGVSSGNPCSLWYMHEFAPSGSAITGLGDLSNKAVYGLQCERAPLKSGATSLTHTFTNNGLIAGSVSDPEEQFAILRTANTTEGAYYLYSITAQKFVKADKTYSETPVADLTIADGSSYGNKEYPWILSLGGAKVNINANGIVLNSNATPDQGNQFKIVVAAYTDLSDAIAAIEAVELMDITIANPNGSATDSWTTETWTQVTENIPADVTAAESAQYSDATSSIWSSSKLIALPAGALRATLMYANGSNRLDILGADLLNENGEVVASDYHFGYSGNAKVNNAYDLEVPAEGTYTIRYWVTFCREANTSNGNITLQHYKLGIPVYSAAELSNEKVYTVTPSNNGNDNVGAWDVNGTMLSLTKYTEGVDATKKSQQFAFLNVNEEFYLYSYGAEKFVARDGAGQKLTEELSTACRVTFDASTIANKNVYPLCVRVEGQHLCATPASWFAGNGGIVTNWNDTGDAGNAVAIVPVDGTVDLSAAIAKIESYQIAREKAELNALIAEAQTLSAKEYINSTALEAAIVTAQGVYDNEDATFVAVTEQLTALTDAINAAGYVTTVDGFSNRAIYTFVSQRGWMGATEGDETVKSITGSADDPMSQWAVYKSANNKYYLYNIGKKMFMGITNNGNIPFAATPQMTTLIFKKSGSEDYPIMFSVDNKGAVNNDNNGNMIYWSGGWSNLNDAGNNHKVAIVGQLDDETLNNIATAVAEVEPLYIAREELDEYLTYFKGAYYDEWNSNPDYKWRDQKGVNNYTIGFEGARTLAWYYNAAEEVAGNAEATADDLTEALDILEGLETWLEINQPEAGKFYRLRCVGGQKYVSADISSSRFEMQDQDHGNPAHMFMYDGEALLSYSQGLYMSHHNFNAVAAKSTVVFTEAANGAKGQYNIKIGERYIYGRGNTQNNHIDSGTGSPTNASESGYNWWLEEVTTLPVTVTAAGWGTFYTPVAVTVPNTVTAYTITAVGEKATLTPVEGTVPAGTGLILEGEGTHNFAIATEDAEGFEKGLLLGSTAKTYVTAEANTTYYVLAKPEGATDAGLYKAALDKNEGTAFLNGANKVYLPVTTEQGAPAMFAFTRGDEENTTGIESVEANEELVIFDLAGRRVQKMEKGIYIVNGKKVVIK